MTSLDAFKHNFQLLFCVSRLWKGGLNADEIEFIREQLKDYSNNVERIYDKLQLTINNHLKDHLTDNFKELGQNLKNRILFSFFY